MTARDLEEVSFFYALHNIEYEKAMEASRKCRTEEWNDCRMRMKVLSLRLKRARNGYYGHLKA